MDCADSEGVLSIVLALLGNRLAYPPRRAVDRHFDPSPRVNLSGRPVREVLSVTDQSGAPVPFHSLGNRNAIWLDAPQRGGACRPDRWVDVTYDYGVDMLPAVVLDAVNRLRSEWSLAASGKPCRLPERVTSVTRQGVSWTLLDPQDFLDDGRTGLYQVDLMLSSFNRGKARARARVFSPEFQPPVRLSEVLLSESVTAPK
jgi:hypothetical protein